jgi:exodeoxyribonuclease VII large subunit
LDNKLELTVSEFIVVFNQTIDYAYPVVSIVGELANLRISKNRWVYFDLKDDESSLKFFGTIYKLPGPLEEGMLIRVVGQPRLHNLYGFSVNIVSIGLVGEGSILRAASLLQKKLEQEGLFDLERKRPLPYPPTSVGLVTSKQSAAYADFIKIINARWKGIEVRLIDVQVQGDIAPHQIISALNNFNSSAHPPEVIVIIRGGGSPEDLAAFNTEQVTRSVASSRIPTLVAIGHEVDISLSELAADRRASTPSNAAELLVPSYLDNLREINTLMSNAGRFLEHKLDFDKTNIEGLKNRINDLVVQLQKDANLSLSSSLKVLEAYNPRSILERGYAIVRDSSGQIIKSASKLSKGSTIDIELARGHLDASVESTK